MIHAMNRMQVEAYLKRDDRAVVPVGSTVQHARLGLGCTYEKPVAVVGEPGRIGVEEIRAALEGTWS